MSDDFRRSVTDALARIAGIAGQAVDCVVARPDVATASADVVADICRVWAALRRVLAPPASTLLVFESALAGWKVAYVLKKQGWTLRNALVGPLAVDSSMNAIGFFFVSNHRYHFDADVIRLRYGKNPGDVVLPGVGGIVERFITATCPIDGRLLELFVHEPSFA
ncbi:hypothetical protein M8542_47800 [Amycolatopsis sp. OK19-0408]|uniref:Uncharacterized protein n=1 Tax=Amycolatopsis iheyensis TaxID=2945988 RepID=A0A9X2NMY4_9PSEU|nr:hypothetical protein [Amycolatopsis iheyensis]MCR6490533.1 hypothetical protein [Amycolatopsis iheyensis]